MQRLGKGKPKKIVKNVRIVTLSDVPPAFLLRPRVIAAIRREVIHDLKKGLKRIPAGCEADWHDQSLFSSVVEKIRGAIWKSK